MQGKIIKNISDDYTVKINESNFVCKAKGKFRKDKIKPLVGDNVLFDENDKIIFKIMTRKNELIRPPIANVDQAVIIASVKKPDFDSNLLDKLLVIIEFNNIKPIICLTKLDLLNKEEKIIIDNYKRYYSKIGYEVYYNDDKKLIDIFKNKVTVFTGQSGAGKSSLLNKLDKNLNLKTDQISLSLGRGKHTTRHTELLEIGCSLIADTPGFSSLDFIGMSSSDIRDNFIEFNLYRDKCKYKDCMHNKEDDCEIKRLVGKEILESRYNNYLKFINN